MKNKSIKEICSIVDTFLLEISPLIAALIASCVFGLIIVSFTMGAGVSIASLTVCQLILICQSITFVFMYLITISPSTRMVEILFGSPRWVRFLVAIGGLLIIFLLNLWFREFFLEVVIHFAEAIKTKIFLLH